MTKLMASRWQLIHWWPEEKGVGANQKQIVSVVGCAYMREEENEYICSGTCPVRKCKDKCTIFGTSETLPTEHTFVDSQSESILKPPWWPPSIDWPIKIKGGWRWWDEEVDLPRMRCLPKRGGKQDQIAWALNLIDMDGEGADRPLCEGTCPNKSKFRFRLKIDRPFPVLTYPPTRTGR